MNISNLKLQNIKAKKKNTEKKHKHTRVKHTNTSLVMVNPEISMEYANKLESLPEIRGFLPPQRGYVEGLIVHRDTRASSYDSLGEAQRVALENPEVKAIVESNGRYSLRKGTRIIIRPESDEKMEVVYIKI